MRKVSLDVCRVLACLAVVLGHTGMLFWDFDPSARAWAFYNLLDIVLRSSVLLFFMVSGVLFLGREKLDFKKHMGRAGHMLLLFYFWSLLCNGIDALWFHYWTPDKNLLELVLSGYFHLWFLPAMAMSYCVLPLLHGLAHGDRDNVRRGAVLLCAMIGVWTTLDAVPDKPGWLAALIAPYHPRVLRYFVMMPLGYVLFQRRLSRRELGLLGLGALAAVLLLAWANRHYAIRIGQASDVFYGDLTISSMLTAAFVFCLSQYIGKLPARLGRVLQTTAACSFGMYLMHPIFLDALRSRHWDLTRYSAVLLYPLCYLCFLLLPMAVSWLLLKIPGLKKLVS